jgi:hypothetical protein
MQKYATILRLLSLSLWRTSHVCNHIVSNHNAGAGTLYDYNSTGFSCVAAFRVCRSVYAIPQCMTFVIVVQEINSITLLGCGAV